MLEGIGKYKRIILVLLTVISLGTTTTYLLNSFDPNTVAPYINQQSTNSIPDNNKLSLAGQHLGSIPEEVLLQLNLESLDVSNNGLTSLPDNIKLLINLKVLNLSNNNLSNIPSVLGDLTSIQELDLSNNKLRTLPSEISNLTNLKTLDLSGNNFSQTELVYISNELPSSVSIIR
ncbi:MAG: leucine-rich repeat domain-containing protein [bacterium]